MATAHIKILYSLAAVLFLLSGFTLHQVYRLQPLTQNSTAQGSAGQSAQQAAQDITVGAAPLTDNVLGTIVEVGANSIKVKDQQGDINSVSISAGTSFKLAGKLRDAATRQRELDAYNAQAKELLKDPVANKAALAAIVPRQEVSTIAFSDLRVGDAVLVSANGTDATGAYKALSVTKSASAGQ